MRLSQSALGHFWQSILFVVKEVRRINSDGLSICGTATTRGNLLFEFIILFCSQSQLTVFPVNCNIYAKDECIKHGHNNPGNHKIAKWLARAIHCSSKCNSWLISPALQASLIIWQLTFMTQSVAGFFIRNQSTLIPCFLWDDNQRAK